MVHTCMHWSVLCCQSVMFHPEFSLGVIVYCRPAKEVPGEVTWKQFKSFLSGSDGGECEHFTPKK